MPLIGKLAIPGRPFLLSAVGRMHGEEPAILAATKEAGHELRAVIHLEITEDEAFRRMQACERDRDDDTPAGLRKRLDEFNAQTVPVLETYDSMGLLIPVDAMPAEGVVFDSMVQLLYERAQNT